VVTATSESTRDVWLRAAAVADVPVGCAVVVPAQPPIAVFNVDGTFYATGDTCTHAKSSLGASGYLEGDVVECAYHFATFCVRDGAALTRPAIRPLATYEVRVDDGVIHVRVPLDGDL
jgi:3-phenylpropionate/trans-cinnamate dioxygenase ferredoxin component